MADLRTLTLGLLVKDDQFRKGLKDSQKATSTFSDKVGKALKIGAAAFAAAGVAAGAFAVKLGKDAINAASDFNEELSKSQVILGDGAEAVAKFAETAATKLGQSRTEALRGAANFAIFGKSAGLSGKELADFSTDFVTLASDLASFNNTSPEDAINAIGAALRGEAEPIRRYGILLNDATLKQQALKLGIIETTSDALTPQQKVLAAQAEIYAQTSDAQGDFARTSDGLANQQRILAASVEDLKISLGESLLPAALNVATFFREQFVPALTGVVNSITGKPDSLTTAIEEGRRRLSGFEAQQLLAERQGFNLGESYKNLGGAIATLANVFRTESSAQGGFKTGLDVLIAINDTIANIILAFANWFAAIRKVINALSDLARKFGSAVGIGPIGAADQILTDIAGNQRPAGTQPLVVNNSINISGAVDPQGTARTVTKVLTQQRAISGVRVTAPSGFF
jgi:hypothetical protein